MSLNYNRLLKPAKKLRKLINKMDGQPTPEEVHHLRTNTRRFEAMFEALSLEEQNVGKSMLKSLVRIRKQAGKVRDMDVLTNYASTIHPDGEEECSIQLLEHLGAQRKKYARKLVAEKQSVGPECRKGLKSASGALTALLTDGNDASNEKAVVHATATAVRLAAQLGKPQSLNKENLHPYRLKIKDLQNVLRMAAGASSAKFIDDLGEVKDSIGEWHDWEELVVIANKVLNHRSRCGLQSELKRITKQRYDHALSAAETLRTTYLQSSHPPKKGAAPAALLKIPRQPVWEATAMLAV
jgi:CHAD domain-containing protein